MSKKTMGDDADAFWAAIRAAHPHFREAVVADARVNAAFRGERSDFRSRADAFVQILRLMLVSDNFSGQVCYRAKARMQQLRIPFLPRLAHRLAIITSQMMIGDPVVIESGVYIVHGQCVIDGFTKICSGAVIAPFTSIGLQAGNLMGPTLERNVNVGTGARVLGEFTVGTGATIGANAVVTKDVAPGAVVVGVPARPVVPKTEAPTGAATEG